MLFTSTGADQICRPASRLGRFLPVQLEELASRCGSSEARCCWWSTVRNLMMTNVHSNELSASMSTSQYLVPCGSCARRPIKAPHPFIWLQGADKEKATGEGATPLRLSAANNMGITPLNFARLQAHQAVVQCLLNASADNKKALNQKQAPLQFAAKQGHLAVAKRLLDGLLEQMTGT